MKSVVQWMEMMKSSTKKEAHGRKRFAKAILVVDAEQCNEMDCRVEEGMEKQEVNDKVSSGRNLSTLLQLDGYCPPLFGTASSSSSNSSSDELPSSHIEFFPSAQARKSSLATTGRPKPVRTRVSPGWGAEINIAYGSLQR